MLNYTVTNANVEIVYSQWIIINIHVVLRIEILFKKIKIKI